MKKLESDILKFLREDCRIPHKRIADALSVSVDKVDSAISEMEKSGLIMRYTVITDASKESEDRVEAFIEVKVSPQYAKGFDFIAEEILQFPEVKSLFLMSGAYDLAVMIEGRNLKEVAAFVSERLSVMDKILSTATHFILKKYKIEGELTGAVNADRMVVTP